MISPGVMLGGRYRLDERIAGGGMGDVWRGTDEVLGRTVAVKILLPALLDEPGFAERFRGEARTMATINHPGVVDVYDYGSDQQIAFLIMEYVEGDALSRTLSRVGRLTPARTMALVAQAADALQAAHEKGIVHRDVKPGNLLVRPNGTLVLTDFGIARSDIVGQLTAAGSVLGTASYISPEQAAGAIATPSSDVYALGVVAYQCLSGRRPFEGDNPLEIAMKHVRELARPLPHDIPPAIRSIVERAMAKDPGARWPTASAFSAVARQAAATLAAPSQPHRPLAPSAPPKVGPISGAPASPALAPSGRATVPGPVNPNPAAPRGGPVNANPAAPRSGPVNQNPAAPRSGGGHPTPPHHAPPPVNSGPPARSGYPTMPANRPPAPAGYGYASVPSAAEPSSGGRRLLVVLAVILGVLVLVCAGVISYMLSQRNSDGGNGGGSSSMAPIEKVTTTLHLPVGGTEAADGPYRLGERILHIGMTSEGMLTR
ncbi:protein kinase [Asanoa sp. WMMD1127]|uniref:serine/threonine-protein kinase n=1 Tax=Asanoa sp. WMMD1127 TaxID=3016107 RepID=UPI0024168521|nr:serine/threonine-protein kinase [Asanoa sp. WMMD1127]MDG4822238.1 protein kinase [Asanoa sp. WMMD1127]